MFLDAVSRKFDEDQALQAYKPLLDSVIDQILDYRTRSFGDLRRASFRLRYALQSNPDEAKRLLPEVFAVFAHAVYLTFGFMPNKAQLFAAILLWEGKVVEMKTGEGKTLTAGMASYLQGLTGRGMHVVTTNEYLAKRDKEWMAILFDRLGISTGLITQFVPRETRKAQYAKDVTYIANQEVAFDYLRDNLVLGLDEKVLRGFPFAIVDEVDSILIDEARTPLIISRGAGEPSPEAAGKILEAVRQLEEKKDYEADLRFKSVILTDAGVRKVIKLLGRDIFAQNDALTIQQVRFALSIILFWKQDREYIVKDNKVILVDEFTGHQMPEHRLMNGMQQILEAWAGVPIREEIGMDASITYRSFYKMYKKLAGMSGTAAGAREEFRDVYNLDTLSMDPYRGISRVDLPTLFFRQENEKCDFIVANMRKDNELGVPILVVGRSIEKIKSFSQLLAKENIPHQTLHAAVSEKEFGIIEAAGKRGAITLATNMAGRGTDIILDEVYKKKTGLYVYGLEPNLSRRVDDQLRGRSGRQGGPGRTRICASLEDEIFQVYGDDALWTYASKEKWPPAGLSNETLDGFLSDAQSRAEHIATETRSLSAEFDEILDKERQFIYALRDRILASKTPVEEITAEIRHILTAEIYQFLSRREFKKVEEEFAREAQARMAQLREPQPPELEVILQTYFAKNPDEEIQAAADPEKIRAAVLQLSDRTWRDYVDDFNWLAEWILVEGNTVEDPLADFVSLADRMMHDMRKDFAFEAIFILTGFNPAPSPLPSEEKLAPAPALQ